MQKWIIAGALLVASSAASADVANLTPSTFIVHHVVELDMPPSTAFSAFTKLPRWWDPEHTYTANASNLTLKLRAGGCLCERLPDRGSVEHLRVSLVQPGERLVLTGALGPLLFQGVAGVMDVQFQKTSRATLVTMDYRVAGFAYGNAEKLAPLVDKVLGEQMARYAAFAKER
jgi:uncharacterized protein YndB with AHSA1/START domain